MLSASIWTPVLHGSTETKQRSRIIQSVFYRQVVTPFSLRNSCQTTVWNTGVAARRDYGIDALACPSGYRCVCIPRQQDDAPVHVGSCTVRPNVSQIGHSLQHSPIRSCAALSAWNPCLIVAFVRRATCVAYGLHCSLETVADGSGSYFVVLIAASSLFTYLPTCL